MSSVLFVGAGRHQRHAIAQARERGLRVVAVDRNAAAPGLGQADVAEVVDFADIDAVEDVARRHGVDGALTVSADRAVPVVAAVTERLGLPTIGTAVAHRMTHKIAMRRTLAESPGREAILEGFVEGTEMNGIVVVRDGDARTVTLSDRLRPAGVGFGVGWIHIYPASIHSDQLSLAERVAERSVAALGLRNGIAFPQLIASPDGGVSVVEVAARIPGGQMADLVRHAVGVDLVEVALRFALGEPVPDEVALPRFSQPLAIRFLTAAPGPLPTGTVMRVGPLDAVLGAPGVVQAETYLAEGETIRPVRLDGDRRGYVIATAPTSIEALRRAEHAAGLLEVEVA